MPSMSSPSWVTPIRSSPHSTPRWKPSTSQGTWSSIIDLPATGTQGGCRRSGVHLSCSRPVDGKIDAASINAVKNTTRAGQDSSERTAAIDDSALADAHTPDRARMYNFECWACRG